MELKMYEREKFHSNLRHMLIKESCEVCGEKFNLELHHDKQFSQILAEALKKLNYTYKLNKEDYTDEELNAITDMVLGMHLRINYTTLCQEHHKEIHVSGRLISHYLILETYKNKKENDLNERIENTKKYLENSVEQVMLQQKDRKELIEKIGVKSNGRLLKKLGVLNNFLEEQKINYRIIQFSTSKMINGKKKNYKNAWKIIKLENIEN